MLCHGLRGSLAGLVLVAGVGLGGATDVEGGLRRQDPAQVVPLDKVAPQHRASLAEVISEPTFHRRGAPESFPCHPRLYLTLVNEPILTLALWKDLSPSPVKLQQVGPTRFQGTNDGGAKANGEFVYRSPKLNVVLADFDTAGPRGNLHLAGRVVLVLRTSYFREPAGDYWVRHELEVFVKVDTKGLRTLARTARPVIEKYMEEQVQEGGWFISLMARLVATYPNWAIQVGNGQDQLPPQTRQTFRELVLQARRAGASNGRPVVADAAAPQPKR
ncbi:MAG TPA: hypothetical protein VG406_20440 [Isosphaeraceae bacterium]|jgi:hypothetical protein|nr:hypothetical protein [Isosphaeraceae bacterium]